MGNLRFWGVVELYQCEGRAGYIQFRIVGKLADQGAGEDALAHTKIPMQGNDIVITDLRGEIFRDFDRFFFAGGCVFHVLYLKRKSF